MEEETNRQLMRQLDKSLLKHTVEIGKKVGGPEISDAYFLQSLAETHNYLKTRHIFKPHEEVALLEFTDPLVAAQACQIKGDSPRTLPLCDLLHEVNAYECFPMVDQSGFTRQTEELIHALNKRLDKNMSDFEDSLEGLTKEEIAEITEVASTRGIYDWVRNDCPSEFKREEAELLLRMENPLEFLVDNWPCDNLAALAMKHLAFNAVEETKEEVLPQSNCKTKNAVVVKKPSILEQLKTNCQKTCEKPLLEERAKGGDAR